MSKKLKELIPEKYKPFLINMLFPFEYCKYMKVEKKYNRMIKSNKLKFQTDIETVNQIIKHKKSLSRFGDGEILWSLGVELKSYQKNSTELVDNLKKVLKNNNENLLIGIPNINDIEKFLLKARMHWTKFYVSKFQEFEKFINYDRVYADTQITRPYIDYKEKSYAKERYENLKRIWDKRDIIIVEGTKTKMGVGNDLFNNAKSIKRIICPATNAFEKYDEIFSVTKKLCKNKLIILALGPTATILANDLCNLNTDKIEYQAIDLGHLDIEYEWFLKNAKKRIAIEGKFVNEVRNKDLSNKLILENDEGYERSIIYRIS